MKKLLVISLSGFLAFMMCSRVTAYSPLDNDFNDIDIVTEDTYKPVDKNISEKMKDAAMNDGNNEIPFQNFRARSADAPYWDNQNGVKSFYDANGTLMYKQGTKMIIDVSKHNGEINWQKVKDSGIDGAIIRLGYGYLGNDEQFIRNISECNRLGIPYGLYLYSYAYDANQAYAEANGTAQILSQVQVNLSYPIYYDIENFKPWVDDDGSTRNPPKTVAEYEAVIGTYINRMNQLGYAGKVHVYSYRSYLQNQLNSSKIYAYVSWVAAYTKTLGFTNKYYTGNSGWQYTSSGSVSGISGRVDISCFSDRMFNTQLSTSVPETLNAKLVEQGIRFNQGYLTGFTLGKNMSTLAIQLSSLGAVTCYNSSGNIVSDAKLATGQRIDVSIDNGTSIQVYVMNIVIKGDVNGDGKISALDYVKVRNHLDKKSTLVSAYLKAGDASNDGKVSALDYVKIRNHLDGKSAIKQ